ncbi:MAG: glycosyltransferase family 4 protein [Anaerolineae bacterium]|nr:glycosyltransferase family 4 protein [Anaerolineae bacterium]
MRIGIDYTSAAHQGAGIGRLTRNIVRALSEIDEQNEYTLLVRGRDLPYPPPVPHPRNVASGIPNDNVREVRTWIDERWWHRVWHRLRLPIPVEWLVGAVDLFHSPDFTLPPVQGRTRTLVTVHDLSFLHLPDCFQPSLLEYLVAHVPRAVARAHCVIADSESTRRDLVDAYGVPPGRVVVIYPAVEPRFRPLDDQPALARVRERYQLPQRFILSLGTIQPRKNYTGLIEAFARLGDPELSLVIVGGRGWLYDDVFAAVREHRLEERVCFPGYVADEDVPALYNLASVFALPSLYEGFGIPPLEAMACGTPVVVANNSSLPEVVGDAGLLVETRDTEALADALDRLLRDAALRRALTAAGLVRARAFTWRRSAEQLLATYERVHGEGGARA